MAYPKFRYHKGLPPVQVRTVEEEANYPESAGWGDVYVRQDWPKQTYGPGGATQVAKDQAALDTLVSAGYTEQAPEMVPPSPAVSAVADENVRLQAQIDAFQAVEDNERLKAQLASLQARAGARLEDAPSVSVPQSPAEAAAQVRSERETDEATAASQAAQARVIEPSNAGNGPSAAAVATAKRQADAEAKAAAAKK
jgi:hypothetical protein